MLMNSFQSSIFVLIYLKRKQGTLSCSYIHENGRDHTEGDVWIWESSWIADGNVDAPTVPSLEFRPSAPGHLSPGNSYKTSEQDLY